MFGISKHLLNRSGYLRTLIGQQYFGFHVFHNRFEVLQYPNEIFNGFRLYQSESEQSVLTIAVNTDYKESGHIESVDLIGDIKHDNIIVE